MRHAAPADESELPHGPPAAATTLVVRRAEAQDATHIATLAQPDLTKLTRAYGHADLAKLYEAATLAVSVVDAAADAAVLGYAAFSDHPIGRDEHLQAAHWPESLRQYYHLPATLGLGDASLPASTAWLAFFVADPLVQTEALELALRAAFTTLVEVDAILFALPADEKLLAPLRDTFTFLEPLNAAMAAPPPLSIAVCPRSLYLAPLRVREARVEDHDDLAPIFDAQSEMLSERYGEFFVAQLIESQDEANRALVAEAEGHAVGLLACSTDIDLSVLQGSFDLEPYDGLVTADDLLELFPERSYALLTLPHTTREFPLLDAFTRLELLPGGSFGHVLYLFHRAALVESLHVRAAIAADAAAIRLLEGGDEEVGGRSDAPSAPAPSADEAALTTYVAEATGQVVGVCRVAAVDPALLRAQYALDDFCFDAHASALDEPEAHLRLAAWALNPIFSARARFFLGEVMRLRGACAAYLELGDDEPVPPIAPQLVKLRPRLLPPLPPTLARELAGAAAALGAPPPPAVPPPKGALHFLSRRLLHEPKLTCNARIVVLGASDAALGALEALVTLPYLNLPSLSLAGRGAAARLSEPAGGVGAHSCAFSKAELAALSLRGMVRTVDEAPAELDRERKLLVMADGTEVPYDFLVLAPHVRDVSLARLGEAEVALRGAFCLGDDDDDDASVIGGAVGAEAVVVYGGSLDAYCCVRALLDAGVHGAAITMVHPPAGVTTPTRFGVEARVKPVLDSRLSAAGVTMLHGWRLAALDGDAALVGARFASADADELELPCDHLVCADAPPGVDRATLMLLDDAGIVVDGGVVVDGAFRTNDPSILAAGPATVLSRRAVLPRGGPRHLAREASPREAGRLVAKELLNVMDLMATVGSDKAQAAPPTYGDVVVTSAKPAPKTRLLRATLPGAGGQGERDLVTSTPSALCVLRVSEWGTVHGLLLVEREAESEADEAAAAWEDSSLLARLVGLPMALLNDVDKRVCEGRVTDMAAFFKEPWAMALYHDRVGELMAEVKAEVSAGAREQAERLVSAARAATAADDDLDAVASLLKRPPELFGPEEALVGFCTERFLEHVWKEVPCYWTREGARHHGMEYVAAD